MVEVQTSLKKSQDEHASLQARLEEQDALHAERDTRLAAAESRCGELEQQNANLKSVAHDEFKAEYEQGWGEGAQEGAALAEDPQEFPLTQSRFVVRFCLYSTRPNG